MDCRCFSCLSATPSSAVSVMIPSLLGRVTHFSANTSSLFLIVDPESSTRPLLSHGGSLISQPLINGPLQKSLTNAYLCCVGSDGKSLAAGGRSNLLHLWCLDTKRLLRVIQMPTQVRTVRQLEFLPDSFDGGASQVQTALPEGFRFFPVCLFSC